MEPSPRRPAPSPHHPARRTGALPILLAALVSPTDDARGFRRHPTALEVGVRLDSERAPHHMASATHGNSASPIPMSYRSVFASDLSLTGLYFVTALPYREGVRLEVSLSLPGQVLLLPATVRRLDAPAHTGQGRLETAFGCGVDFRHRETSAQARRALMEFLVRRAVPA